MACRDFVPWAICKLLTMISSCSWLLICNHVDYPKKMFCCQGDLAGQTPLPNFYFQTAQLFGVSTLFIDVSHCQTINCVIWLRQCNDSDLSQNSWELGILLVVPDNLYGVLIPQLTIIPLFDPDHSWPPTLSWRHLTLSIFLYIPGGRWGSPEPLWATINNPLALLYSFTGYLTQILCLLGK